MEEEELSQRDAGEAWAGGSKFGGRRASRLGFRGLSLPFDKDPYNGSSEDLDVPFIATW